MTDLPLRLVSLSFNSYLCVCVLGRREVHCVRCREAKEGWLSLASCCFMSHANHFARSSSSSRVVVPLGSRYTVSCVRINKRMHCICLHLYLRIHYYFFCRISFLVQSRVSTPSLPKYAQETANSLTESASSNQVLPRQKSSRSPATAAAASSPSSSPSKPVVKAYAKGVPSKFGVQTEKVIFHLSYASFFYQASPR